MIFGGKFKFHLHFFSDRSGQVETNPNPLLLPDDMQVLCMLR